MKITHCGTEFVVSGEVIYILSPKKALISNLRSQTPKMGRHCKVG